MLKIGITGGIGSGKSTVCSIFLKLGIPVYQADVEAKKLYADPEIKMKISVLFGDEIYQNGSLDRKKLASIVFQDKEKLEELNQIIHPAVAKHYESWLLDQNAPYVIKEAAIMFESGAYRGLDKVVTVACPEEIRLARVLKRDAASEEEVRGRMRHQMSERERIEKSDLQIVNDGKEMLLPQILKLHEDFISTANS